MSSQSLSLSAWPHAEPASAAFPPPVPGRLLAKAGLALLVGICVYVVSFLVVPQVMVPNVFGIQWQRTSEVPFAFEGQFPHRMLAPLLAHYLGLGGERWIIFTQLSAVLLLSLVFHVARWRGSSRLDAFLVALAASLTGAIQIYKVNMIGYVDNFGYSLSLIAWMMARRSLVFWGLILLNLTNHEMVAFFTPWFLFVRRQAGASLRSDALGLVAVGVLYVLYRQWVGAHAPTWTYHGDYFLSHSFLPTSFVFLWFLAAVYLLQTFGPMLAIVVWHALRMRPDWERMHTLLIVAGFLSIFFFAYDTNRHSNMILFPLIVASGRFLGDRRSRFAYLALIGATVATTQYWWWVYDWMMGVMLNDCSGHLLILPENRFDLALQWGILVGTVERSWHVLFGLAWGALFLLGLAQWLARHGIGGARLSTAGLVTPAMEEGAIGAFRRATAQLWHRPRGHRPRSRDPRVGT